MVSWLTLFLYLLLLKDGVGIHSSLQTMDCSQQLLLFKAVNNSEECIYAPTGEYSVKHAAHEAMTLLTIDSIVDLSCICTTVANYMGGIYEEQFLNVRGAMIHNDCGALRFLTKVNYTMRLLVID